MIRGSLVGSAAITPNGAGDDCVLAYVSDSGLEEFREFREFRELEADEKAEFCTEVEADNGIDAEAQELEAE